MLGPIPWVDTSGPEGGRGRGLRSGTELLRPPEQAEVGTEDTEQAAAGDFSISVLCLALTIPTGMEPERRKESVRTREFSRSVCRQVEAVGSFGES